MRFPLFILMGEFLMRSGVTDRMYDTLAKWLNPLPGGLLHTNVVACALFACVSGSSAATAATISSVSLPALRSYGYNVRLSLGSLAAGGTLGILIPPSITFIVYAVLVEESIGQLYIAAIVPGILMTLSFMVVIFIAAIRRPQDAPRVGSSTWREKFVSLGALLPVFGLMLVVLGTMFAGIATATEAAGFGAALAFLLAAVNGRVNRKMLAETFIVTATTTAMIMFILFGAFVLQFVLGFLGIPTAVSNWIAGLGLSKVQVVLLICLCLSRPRHLHGRAVDDHHDHPGPAADAEVAADRPGVVRRDRRDPGSGRHDLAAGGREPFHPAGTAQRAWRARARRRRSPTCSSASCRSFLRCS